MTLIKDPLSPENAEKLEEAAKDVSKAAAGSPYCNAAG